MLVRMCKKGNTCALLVGMEIDAATVENSMVFPQKIELPYDLAIPLLGTYLKKRNINSKRYMYHCHIIYNHQDIEKTLISIDG